MLLGSRSPLDRLRKLCLSWTKGVYKRRSWTNIPMRVNPGLKLLNSSNNKWPYFEVLVYLMPFLFGTLYILPPPLTNPGGSAPLTQSHFPWSRPDPECRPPPAPHLKPSCRWLSGPYQRHTGSDQDSSGSSCLDSFPLWTAAACPEHTARKEGAENRASSCTNFIYYSECF